MLLIHRSSDTPIRPRDIESDTTFDKVFGKRECEVAAYWVVRYCQARRSWAPFEFDRLVRFCLAHDSRFQKLHDYLLEGVSELVLQGFLQTEKRSVTLTTSFVARCYGSSPVAGLPRRRPVRVHPSKARSRYERLVDEADLI
jgi:hypothetical protein